MMEPISKRLSLGEDTHSVNHDFPITQILEQHSIDETLSKESFENSDTPFLLNFPINITSLEKTYVDASEVYVSDIDTK